jgi:hypothetical protein
MNLFFSLFGVPRETAMIASKLSSTCANNLANFTAVLVGLVIGVGYPLLTPWRGVDYDVFLSAAQGDPTGWFYGQWALVFIAPYTALPYNIAWAIFSLLNVVGIAYATCIFKGSQVLAMTCYAFTINVWYGQINGIYAASLRSVSGTLAYPSVQVYYGVSLMTMKSA